MSTIWTTGWRWTSNILKHLWNVILLFQSAGTFMFWASMGVFYIVNAALWEPYPKLQFPPLALYSILESAKISMSSFPKFDPNCIHFVHCQCPLTSDRKLLSWVFTPLPLFNVRICWKINVFLCPLCCIFKCWKKTQKICDDPPYINLKDGAEFPFGTFFFSGG